MAQHRYDCIFHGLDNTEGEAEKNIRPIKNPVLATPRFSIEAFCGIT